MNKAKKILLSTLICLTAGFGALGFSSCEMLNQFLPLLPHEHAYTEESTVAPTCTESGYRKLACSCGEFIKDNEVAPLGHTEVTDEAVAPTCTETGLSEGKHCTVCSTVTVPQEIIPANGHTEVIDAAVAPTCTKTGLSEGKHCSVCSTVTVPQETIGKSNHTEVIDAAVAPTCTETGLSEGKHCSVCSTVTVPQTVVNPTGHNFVNKHCNACNTGYYSEGLVFTLNSDSSSYSVKSVGTCTEANVIIPSVYQGKPVTGISNDAFKNCASLASVEFPNSLTSIGDYAFSACPNLKSVELPNSVTTLGYGVFYNSTGLTSAVLPNTLTSISNSLFSNCTSLTSVEIPKDVTTIGNAAFDSTNLKDVEIPEGVTTIGAYAFRYSNLTNLKIPATVTTIGPAAFWSCTSLKRLDIEDLAAWCNITFQTSSFSTGHTNPLTNENVELYVNGELVKDLVIPNGVETISDYAFYGFRGVTSLVIPDSVTTIGDFAFYECYNLVSVELGDNVTTVDYAAFGSCFKLTYLTLNDKLETIGVEAFRSSNIIDLVIPDSVTKIESGAFKWDYNLVSVVIGEKITDLPTNTFDDCYKLIEIYNKSSVYMDVGFGLGEYSKNVYTPTSGQSKLSTDEKGFIIYTDGEEKLLVGYHGSDKKLTLPTTVTQVYTYAFYERSDFVSLTIPDNVTTIGAYAFYNCYKLMYLEIGNGVTTIDQRAFYACSSLLKAVVGEKVETLAKDAFQSCGRLVEVYNKSALNIEKHSTDHGYLGDAALNVYTPTSGQTMLSQNEDGFIFFINQTLKYVIAYLGTETHVVIPEGTTYIYKSALAGNTTMQSVYIPSSVTRIESNAFNSCLNLTKVEVASVYDWCKIVFAGGDTANPLCPSAGGFYEPQRSVGLYVDGQLVTDLVVPEPIKKVQADAFFYYRYLNSVTLSDSVTTISGEAFFECENLTSVVIGSGVTNIESSAFNGCDSLTTVYYKGTAEDWKGISIHSFHNDRLTNATRYYYVENEADVPTDGGNYWHYDENGKIAVW